jgi:hypothetical protein
MYKTKSVYFRRMGFFSFGRAICGLVDTRTNERMGLLTHGEVIVMSGISGIFTTPSFNTLVMTSGGGIQSPHLAKSRHPGICAGTMATSCCRVVQPPLGWGPTP